MSRFVEQDRPFQVAFVVALLFHVSALTLFSVVVRFQRAEIPYSTLTLVDSSALRNREPLDSQIPINPVLAGPLDAAPLQLTETPTAEGLLPTLSGIRLPAIAFLEPERLRLQKLEQALQSHTAETAPATPIDTWRTFSGGLRETGEYFGQLVSGKRDVQSSDADTDQDKRRVELGALTPGVDAAIEWTSRPLDRRPEFVLPLQAMPDRNLSLGAESSIPGPVSIVFRVNTEGSVVDVIPPVAEEGGLVDSVVRTLKRYKFRPLSADETQQDQIGTLILEPSHP